MTMQAQSIDPAEAEQVTSALAEFLRSRHGVPGLSFAEPARLLADGTDTFVYGFRLEDPRLEAAWRAPLVIRIFKCSDDVTKGEHESAVQRFAAASGFRTPAILAFERDGARSASRSPSWSGRRARTCCMPSSAALGE